MTSEEMLTDCHRMLKRICAAMDKKAAGDVADDRDLDGEHGDPTVKFDPRGWTGESFKGRRYSETAPEFLDLLADALAFFAQKKAQTEPKKAGWDKLDAARARGWAARLRAGWKAPTVASGDGW
jgi:hypothetical protein